MNTVNLSGVICTTPKFEISETESKDLLANFCIRNTTKGGKTSYIWCTVIGAMAQKIMELNIGNFVILEGELVCYDKDRYYFYTVEVNSLEIFVNKKNEIISQQEKQIIEKTKKLFFNKNKNIENQTNSVDDFYKEE